ncbi:uncharacterized protein LOC119097981 [Pollicipes pollicipes]|uniref:uncharacterized protein LOC119097981 n=1 Tax=Pollicipes pollicipes TaxID=41117 RepID=UPI001884A341|nr:uncharacterized protein LOC119097981 [Pollicipes pollicipes]
MSVICRHFVQNAWRKDLCSNCFKSEEEHAPRGAPRADALRGLDDLTRRYSPQARPYTSTGLSETIGRSSGSLTLKSTALLRGLQPRSEEPDVGMGRLELAEAPLAASGSAPERTDGIVHAAVNRALLADAAPAGRRRGILVLEGRGGGRQRRSVAFSDEPEVIGFGGETAEMDEESSEDEDEPESAELADPLGAEERSLLSLTQRNTDFNSINSNLSGTSRTLVDWLDENDSTTERSALTGRHKKFTPLVSIAPFSSGRSPGGVKVNLVAPMKNGEIITESRDRFEMVEKRASADPISSAKMAEKITRLDDLIDEKPKKTTSVEITNSESPERGLVAETVSITEFERSAGDRVASPPLVETRFSFAIGGRRGAPAVPEGKAPPTETSRPPSVPLNGASTAAASNGKPMSSKSALGTAEEAPSQSGTFPDEAGDDLAAQRPLKETKNPRPSQNKDLVEESDKPNASSFYAVKTTHEDHSNGLDSAKAENEDSSSTEVSFEPTDERHSVTRSSSVEANGMHNGFSETGSIGAGLSSRRPEATMSHTTQGDNGNGDEGADERKSDHKWSLSEQLRQRTADEARRSAHSSALQKLIDEDVVNQNVRTESSSTRNGQPLRQRIDTASEEQVNKVNLMKSRFSEKQPEASEDLPMMQSPSRTDQCEPPKKTGTDSTATAATDSSATADTDRTATAATDSTATAVTDSSAMAATDSTAMAVTDRTAMSATDASFGRVFESQSKGLVPSMPPISKPSPRTSFLHSLTNSRADESDNTFSDFLASTLFAPITNSAVNGTDTPAENPRAKTDGEEEAKPAASPRQGVVSKASDTAIRPISKPASGTTKPPILREKPKIAAKPAKLHRLSRTTSTDSESSVRPTSEARETERGERDPPKLEPLGQEASCPITETRKQEDEVMGAVCVAVKSPVLDASTRLTKLVESAKTVRDEPIEKSRLTISVSPPRPPARKESLTRKERAMKREKDLEKQREELEKRHKEELDEEQVVKRSTEVRKEHRPAPQPPPHRELERTTSSDYEANRAAIANLLSLGHRGSTTKRQAPRVPTDASSQDRPAQDTLETETRDTGGVQLAPDAETKDAQEQDPHVGSEVMSKPEMTTHSSETEESKSEAGHDSGEADGKGDDNLISHAITATGFEEKDNHHSSLTNSPKQRHDSNDNSANASADGQEKDSITDIQLKEDENRRIGHEEDDNGQKNDFETRDALTNAELHTNALKVPFENGHVRDVQEAVEFEHEPEPSSDEQKTDVAEPETEEIPRIKLKVESPPVPAPVHNEHTVVNGDSLQNSRDLTQGEAPLSLPVQTNGATNMSIKDDKNPYASTAIFDRRSSFKPDIDDDDDLPPSASMRSSSVSPRSRKRASNVVSFDPAAEFYSRETVLIKPRSQSMPRSGQVEGLMTDDEVKKKIYGVSSVSVFATGGGGGERKSRRDEPKRRGKFSLKKFLKFGKDDKKKEKERGGGEQRAKPEIIHPIDLTPAGSVQVIVRTEEEKRRDEAERQRKKALLIAEGTRVYDSPSFSKGPLSPRPLEKAPAASPTTPSGPTSAPWQRGSLGFNSEGRPKPPPPPRRTSSIDQSEVALGQTPPSRPPPPNPEVFSRSRDGSDRSTGQRETEYANLGTNRAGLTPRKPDRGGSVRQESPQPRAAVVFDADTGSTTQLSAATTVSESPKAQEKPDEQRAPGVSEPELPRQRPSRVSLRKQTSVVHANLEENYDAVTASNHEALLQLLEQVSERRPVPAALRPLEHNPALAFTHFKVAAESHVTCGRRAFLRAEHREQPVLLMLSSEPAATPAASLPPLAQFRDLVQGHLLPKASTGSFTSAMQATVWVFPPVQVQPFWDLVSSQPTISGQQEEQQVCLLLLQTVHHLLELQARGQQFVDQSLCELVATEADGDAQCRLVAVYGNYESRQKLTGCQAALAVMLRMLGVPDALERVRDGRGVSVPDVPSLNAFELLASLLLREDGSALRRARAVLEYLLWGPADLELTEAESSLQRWLDLERATVLNNLIRTQKLWSVELSVLEEFRLMFLVHTDAATLKDASELLDI